MLEVGVSSDNKYRELLLPCQASTVQARHNQIANCKNADGISTILSIVCPYVKRGCIQIFFMQKIVEKQQEEMGGRCLRFGIFIIYTNHV